MKKILPLALAAGLVFILGCAKSGPATVTTTDTAAPIITGQDIPERQAYESKADGFSIQFPGTRTLQENVYGSSVMFFTPLADGDTLKENVGVMKKALDKEYTLEEYYAITKPELTKLIPDFTEISNESIKVNDIDAQKLIYKGTQGTTKLQREQVYLIKDKAVYIVTYTATENTFNQYNQKVDEMVATLEIK